MTHNPQTRATDPHIIAMHESASFHASKDTAMRERHGHGHEPTAAAEGGAASSSAAPPSPEHSLPMSFPHDEDPVDQDFEDALMYFAVADDEGGGHQNDVHDDVSISIPASRDTSQTHGLTGTAATTPSATNANAADLSVYESGLMRSVHMELQENARIPTFLDNVDRSNSSGVVRKVGSPTIHPVDISEVKMSLIGESSDHTKEPGGDGAAEGGSGAITLAEKFLRSSHRESEAMNYSIAGELTKLDPTSVVATTGAEKGKASSTGAAGVLSTATDDKAGDTTPPFSRGVPVSAEMILETASALAASMGPAAAAPGEQQQQQPSHSSYYPYGRAVQLPIPSPPGPKPVRRADAEVDRGKAAAADPSTSTTVKGGPASHGGSSLEKDEGNSVQVSKEAAAPSSAKVSGSDDSATSKGGNDGSATSKDSDSKATGGPTNGLSAGSGRGNATASQSASSSITLTPPPSASSFTPPPLVSVHTGNSVIAPAPHPPHGGPPVHAQHHHPTVGSLPYPPHMAMPHNTQSTTYLPHQHAHHPHHSPWATTTTTTVSTDTTGGGEGGDAGASAGAAAAHHHHHHHHHHVVPVMTNSIREATRMQNQFGFGGDHVVPSVPLPPMPHARALSKTPPVPPMKRVTATKVRSSARGAKKAGGGGTGSDAAGSTTTTTGAATADESPVPASVSNRVAYERKKEKAKHGRVKLNESIERLSVAMNLAGSRSRQQAETFAREGGVFGDRDGGGVEGEEDGAAADSDVVRTMLECQRIAREAKKFDRPAFIGHAASMVQALNNQCEALVREVRYLKKRSVSNSSSPTSADSSGLAGTGCQSAVAVAAHDRSSGMKVDSSRDDVNCGKKRKISDSSAKAEPRIVSNFPPCTRSWTECNVDWFSMAVTHGPVVKTIASYLDPSSLMRCQCVAKYWKAIDEFKSDETWMDLCVHRFGRENVRRWENRVSKNSSSTTSARSRNKMQVYKEMCSANVAPHSPMEGNLRLGEANVDGVSAWASMMARSNGETLRSVKQGSAKGNIHYGTGSIQVKDMVKGNVEYSSLPVVELRLIVQNTGIDKAVVVPDQAITVDASTRRRGEELVEVASDERFQRRVVHVNGRTVGRDPRTDPNIDEMFRLRLFDAVVLQVHIHARGCPTTAKFQKKANFTKLLVTANGTTFPVVIPFGKGDDVSLSISKFEPEKG